MDQRENKVENLILVYPKPVIVAVEDDWNDLTGDQQKEFMEQLIWGMGEDFEFKYWHHFDIKSKARLKELVQLCGNPV